MPDQQEQYLSVEDFSGGMNAKLDSRIIGDNQVFELQNVDHSLPGLLQTRKGRTTKFQNLAGSGYKPKGMFYYAHESGAFVAGQKLMIVFLGGQGLTYRAYYAKPSDASFIFTGSFSSPLFYGEGDIASLQFQNQIICAQDGTGVAYKMDDASSTSGALSFAKLSDPSDTDKTVFPSGHIMASAFGRIFVSGNSVPMTGAGYTEPKPGYIWFSEYYSPFKYDRVNWAFRVSDGEGRKVIALQPIRNEELITFLDQGIHRLIPEGDAFSSGPYGFTITPKFRSIAIDHVVGCGSRKGVALIGEDIVFVDRQGHVRSLARTALEANQGAAGTPLSDAITPYIERINKAALDRCTLTVYNNVLRYSVPLDGALVNTHTFHFDYRLGSWSGPHTYAVGYSVVCDFEGDVRMYSLEETDSPINLFKNDDSLKDDSTTISYQETTKKYNFGQPKILKSFDSLIVDLIATETSNMTAEASVDGKAFQTLKTTADGSTLDTAGTAQTMPLSLPFMIGENRIVRGQFSLKSLGKGYDIQYRFKHGSSGIALKKRGHTTRYMLEEVPTKGIRGGG